MRQEELKAKLQKGHIHKMDSSNHKVRDYWLSHHWEHLGQILNHEIRDYNINKHWEYIEQICSLAERLEPEQTLRVYVGNSHSEEGIKDLKHAANKLKQDLFGRIFGFTPSVWGKYDFVFLDVCKHKQRERAA